jgi:hypothetical protein
VVVVAWIMDVDPLCRRWPGVSPEQPAKPAPARYRDEATAAALQAYLAGEPDPVRVIDLRL